MNAVVKQSNNDDAADEINQEHAWARAKAESAVGHAIRCGELLIKQKKRLQHGDFQLWVKEHCRFSHDTANIYMRAFRRKTSGLVFSSLSELLDNERADRSPLPAPPLPKYVGGDIPPDVALPPGHDVQLWSYSHQTAKRLRWFAKFVGELDALAVARGALPDEVAKLRPHVHRIHYFAAELSGALSGLHFCGIEPKPMKDWPIDEVRKALWNINTGALPTEQEARTPTMSS